MRRTIRSGLGLTCTIALLACGCGKKTVKGGDKAAPAGRPTSKEALIQAAVAAVKGNKPADYAKLLPSMELIKRACPEAYDKARDKIVRSFERMRRRLPAAINACGALLDWSKARQIRVAGGRKSRRLAKGCQSMYELKDIKVYFEADGKTVRLRIDDPVIIDDKLYAVMDRPRCRLHRGGSGDRVESPATRKVGPRVTTPYSAPTSREALIRAALSAVKSNRPTEYLKLIPSLEVLEKACPAAMAKARQRIERALAKARREIPQDVARCVNMVDWSKARQLRIEGGEQTRPLIRGCDKVMGRRDIYVHFAVGSKKLKLKLDVPVVIGQKGWGVLESLNCTVR